MDGRIVHCDIISSPQSAVTYEIVVAFRHESGSCKHSTPGLYNVRRPAD